MTWFERYAIPGAYAILLCAAWVFPVLPRRKLIEYKDFLIGVGALAVLPLGYVLSVLEQRRYLRGDGVQKDALEQAAQQLTSGSTYESAEKEFLQEKRLSCCEAAIEAFGHSHAAIRARSPNHGDQNKSTLGIDQRQFYSGWIRKRLGIVAANNALIWATVVIPLITLLTAFVCWREHLQLYAWVLRFWGCLVVGSVGLILLLRSSQRIIRQQVVDLLSWICLYEFAAGGLKPHNPGN